MADSVQPTPREQFHLRGDEDELFAAHHDELVLQLQLRLSVPREVAEDAMSNAWLKFLRHQPERDRAIGWLYTTAKRETFATAKRWTRERPTDWSSDTCGEEEFEDLVEARVALERIAELKPQQRVTLWLRVEGYTYRAICELTGRTYTWVNRHVSEGRQAWLALVDRG